MKKKLLLLLSFFIMPVFIPIYVILDGALLVDIFGCGCPAEYGPCSVGMQGIYVGVEKFSLVFLMWYNLCKELLPPVAELYAVVDGAGLNNRI